MMVGELVQQRVITCSAQSQRGAKRLRDESYQTWQCQLCDESSQELSTSQARQCFDTDQAVTLEERPRSCYVSRKCDAGCHSFRGFQLEQVLQLCSCCPVKTSLDSLLNSRPSTTSEFTLFIGMFPRNSFFFFFFNFLLFFFSRSFFSQHIDQTFLIHHCFKHKHSPSQRRCHHKVINIASQDRTRCASCFKILHIRQTARIQISIVSTTIA